VTDSDRYYVDIVRAGNSRAFSTIVDRHKDRAMTLAVRMLGNREEAEEVVQDAFLRAFRGLDQFRGDAKFSTWFYRILHNLCFTRISRRRGSAERIDDHEGQDLESMVSPDDVGIQEQMESDELRRLVGEQIEMLPPKLKSAVVLFYLEGSSYEETAEILNIPVGTVKTYLHRGRNLLRERLITKLKDEENIS
jgi:RNA polymerase sigma-70 factor (ECF subfamily)